MRPPQNDSPREVQVEGVVEEIVFQTPDARFAVVVIRPTKASTAREAREDAAEKSVSDSQDRVSGDALGEPVLRAVGDLGQVAIGETLRMRGTWAKHSKFGKQLKVRSFTPVIPTTGEGIRKYLGSGLVPGIGKGLAGRLVDAFGDETLEIIATQSGRLREVPGIGKSRAGKIADAVRVRRDEAEGLAFLHGLGLGPALARRVFRKYGVDAGRQLKDDPYLVAEQVRGVGFKTADLIGHAVGIGSDDPRRAAGAVLHVLARGADDGHVFLERTEIETRTRKLDVPGERVDEAIDALDARGLVHLDGDAVYPPPLFAAECAVAKQLAVLSRARKALPNLESAVAKGAEGQELSATQTDAVRASLEAGLMVLTGGPGTGKTTTVKAIVRAQEAAGRRVLLCAPTGRAAKRLSDATDREASTIHRLLQWNPQRREFQRDSANPLDAEIVLVDEASMVDLQLAGHLVAAVAPSSRLVLVGDVDQLPPVSAGQVLREVIASDVPRVVRLQEVFRQAEKSAIVRGAHALLRGSVPTPTPAREHAPTEADDEQLGDLFVVRAKQAPRIRELLVALLSRMTKTYGFDPLKDVQVLTPMRRGPLGTESLNELLQIALNGGADPKRAGMLFPGDKVMQLRNDYEREVFNGDLGLVRRVEGGITYVMVDGREVKYAIDDLDALTLAYCSTIHKVQGSEFPAVVVILHPSHHVLLSRALVYTAVTRAKKLVVLLGDPTAIARAARNVESHESNSRLAARLRHADQDRDQDDS